MGSPFLGELRVVAFNYPPIGWAFCDGQLLSVAQNTALYSLLGNYYGGVPNLNFNLPDLRGRAMTHTGTGYAMGSTGGEEAHALNIDELPGHSHLFEAGMTLARKGSPVGATLAATSGLEVYGEIPDDVLAADAVSESVGGGQPHPNLPPYLVLNVMICLSGIFPVTN